MKSKFKIDEMIAICFLVSMLAMGFIQVTFRMINAPISWSEEIIRYSLICLVYLSTAIVIKEGTMIRVEIIDLFVKGKAKQILDLVIYCCSGLFLLYISYLSTFLVQNAFRVNQLSPSLQIPFAGLYAIECAAFFLMFLMYVKNIVVSIKKMVKGG